MKIQIAEISFSGNLSKTYDFYTDFYIIQKGDIVVCDTTRGPSIGKVVKLKPFSERSKECARWLTVVLRKDMFGNPEDIEKNRRKLLEEAETEEMLS